MKTIKYEKGIKPEPGMIITGMPDDIYHASPGISKSGLDKVARSPAHFRYATPKDRTRFMVIGTAIHIALLEPQRYANDYVILKEVDKRTDTVYKQAIKIHNEDFVLVSHEADYIAGMKESAYANHNTRQLLTMVGFHEVSVFATDPVTGELVRCRFDILSTDFRAADIKKCQDARPDAFTRAIQSYNYHVQTAFYTDVFKWATGEDLQSYSLLAIEEDLPHASKIYTLDEIAIVEGRNIYRAALDTYAACKQAEYWPAYDTAPECISLPAWVLNQLADREVELSDE